MSPEAQRRAIAKACRSFEYRKDGLFLWHTSTGTSPTCPLRDLNAMHEVERLLPNVAAIDEYGRLLRAATRGGDYVADHDRSWHATAAQRAEAFLRTIGKWEESG